MKRFECPAVAAVLAVTVALLAPSPSIAGAGHDRVMHNSLLNTSWRDLGNQTNHRFNSRNAGFDNSVPRVNRTIDTASTLNLINQIRTNRSHGNRFNQQLRFSIIQAGSLPSDLNLSSCRDTYVAPTFNGTVTITQGGKEVSVNNSSSLTAAEAVAVHQVLYDGGQSITLGKRGDAEGGSMNLSGDLAQNLSSLIIPKGVTVTSDFGNQQNLNITGDIINAGRFLAISTIPSASSAIVNASNITNRASGVLSSTTSANPLDLDLVAQHQIVNNGQIQSSGNLSLTAGDAILNTHDSGYANVTPTIAAAGSLTLNSKTIVNDGIASATAGNIYLANSVGINASANAAPTNISILSNDGVFRTDNGDIVVGNNSLRASDSIVMSGGNYYSNNLLVNAGAGTADGTVGDVTGQLKVNAGEAHLGASTSNLLLGQSDINGDPTFFNSLGAVTITGDLVYGQSIAILASGYVTDVGNAFNITANDGTNGHPITIIAGAKLTPSVGAVANPFATDGNQITAGTVSVSGASSTGGDVMLQSSTISSAGLAGGSGAKTTILAFAAKDGSSGSVFLKTLNTGGNGAGDNGDITIIAGHSINELVPAISAPTINASGGTGKGAIVTLINAQPTAKLSFDTNGVMTGTPGSSTKLGFGGISTDVLSALGGAVTIKTAAGANLGTSFGLTDVSGATPGASAGSLTVIGGNVGVMGSINAIGQDGVSSVIPGQAGSDAGNGGAVSLTATGNVPGQVFVQNTATINTSGGTGGFGATGAIAVGVGGAGGDGSAGGAGGKGGNITFTTTNGVSLFGSLIASGGAGGGGASGTDGNSGTGIISGGNGGSGGAGGSGGSGGNISLVTKAGDVVANNFDLQAYGGQAGNGASGGSAASNSSASNGNAGQGGAGGLGGNGGAITVSSGAGNISLRNLDSHGGGGGQGGIAGFSSTTAATDDGGSGGTGGAGGSGGNAGNVTVTNKGSSLSVLGINAQGGDGGHGEDGHSGGDSTSGKAGQGGNSANGGNSGNGGTVTLTSSGTVSAVSDLNASCGLAGFSGIAGDGGATSGGTGSSGSGGTGGNGGNSGIVGSITITGTDISLSSVTAADSSTATAGQAGNAGTSFGSKGGNGGSGGSSGNAASGGTITITGTSVSSADIDAFGGDSSLGAAGANGAATVDAGNGGAGGNGGSSGNSGNGGVVKITASAGSLSLASVFAYNGLADSGGDGGAGGSAGGPTFGSGGVGGNGGAIGATGKGGSIILSSKGSATDINTIDIFSSLNIGVSSHSGNGGDAGTSTSTTTVLGGTAGAVGSSGGGGLISISSAGAVNVGEIGLSGGYAAGAGSGGAGGSSSSGSGVGSVGMNGGNGANGAIAGSLTIKAKGDLTTGTIDATGGSGGFGGGAGAGGFGPAGGGNAGSSGQGGTGAAAGTIKISNTAVNKTTIPTMTLGTISAYAGFGGDGGASAGGGGAASGTGGTGSFGGTGGAVIGKANKVSISSKGITNLDVVNVSAGTGGKGSSGGDGGVGTTGGAGGGGARSGLSNLSGSLTIKSARTFQSNNLFADGASSLDSGSGGGGGASSGATTGVAGGDGALGIDGTKAGKISVTTSKGFFATATMESLGGTGGTGGDGGNGGSGVVNQGAGGNAGDGGNGGDGNSVSLKINAGSSGVAFGGTAGAGGSGGTGVPLGAPGVAGTGGADGKVKIQ